MAKAPPSISLCLLLRYKLSLTGILKLKGKKNETRRWTDPLEPVVSALLPMRWRGWKSLFARFRGVTIAHAVFGQLCYMTGAIRYISKHMGLPPITAEILDFPPVRGSQQYFSEDFPDSTKKPNSVNRSSVNVSVWTDCSINLSRRFILTPYEEF